MRRTPKTAMTAVLLLASLVPAACGDDDEATAETYCQAWATVESAVGEVVTIDVTEDVGEQLRSGTQQVQDALADFQTAAGDQFGDERETFGEAVRALLTTIVSPDLPVDRRDEVRAALDDVRTTWATLVEAVRVDCP